MRKHSFAAAAALALASTLVSVPASAQQTTEVATRAVTVRGRFPGSVIFGTAPQAGPLLGVGVRFGRIDLSLGLTVTTFGFSESRPGTTIDPMTGQIIPGGATRTSSISGLLFYVGPTFNYTVFESDDRRGRAYVGGTIVVGTAGVTQSSERGSTTTSDDESVVLFGGMAHVGGEYLLGRNFSLGLEAGYGLLFASHTGEGTTPTTTALNTTGTFVALTGTLILPL